jgi:hypothetical protein
MRIGVGLVVVPFLAACTGGSEGAPSDAGVDVQGRPCTSFADCDNGFGRADNRCLFRTDQACPTMGECANPRVGGAVKCPTLEVCTACDGGPHALYCTLPAGYSDERVAHCP